MTQLTHELVIDGKVVTVTFRFDCLLPKLLGAGGTTLGTTVRFKRKLVDGNVRIGPILVAHECIHVAQFVRLGWVKYLRGVFFGTLEQEARLEAPLLLANRHPSISRLAVDSVKDKMLFDANYRFR